MYSLSLSLSQHSSIQGSTPSPRRSPIPEERPGPSSVSGTSVSLITYSPHQLQPPSPRPYLIPARSQYPIPRPRPPSASNVSQSPVPRSLHQVPSSNPQSSQAPIQISSPCELSRPSLILRPNLSAIKIKPTTSNLQIRPPYPPRPPQNDYINVDQEGNFFCKVCQVPCSGALNLKQHLKGHKHKAKLQFLQLNKRGGVGSQDNPQMRCELCQIWCSNEDALQMHLKGQKHKAKRQELGSGREKETQRPWCELCEIWCMDEGSFHLHLKGKKHITHLYEVKERKKARGEDS